jgi:predicted N-acetyltransferase YhbS
MQAAVERHPLCDAAPCTGRLDSSLIRGTRETARKRRCRFQGAAVVRHPDGVASFVERIRTSEQVVPELALVAEDSSGVIAHVMLSWVGVQGGSGERSLNLTPVSVRPDRQRIGAGVRLSAIRSTAPNKQASLPSWPRASLPSPRFGFGRASALGFTSPHPKIPDDAFMAKRLPEYSPDLAGRIVYPATFDALGY